MLQYGLSEGYLPLRHRMKTYLAEKEGIDFDKNELFIVSGGHQCADLVTKVLVNEGDVILTEEPAFIGCLNTFRSYGAKLVGVPMQADGMDLAALQANPNAKLLYTIPSFQNPTGITTTLEKRKAVYALCRRYNVAILEDNPYGELRFSGETVPTIKSMDADGRVLYAGSFSKVMAPAFRLGFLVFDKSLTAPITVAKQCTDVHSNLLFQHICDAYMEQYDFEEHLNASRAVYRRKCSLMLDAMRRCFHPEVTFGQPEGGLSLENVAETRVMDGVSCVGTCHLSAPGLEKLAENGVHYAALRTIGFDNVDLEAAERLGIRISYAAYSPYSVANYTVMLMLMCIRKAVYIMFRSHTADCSLGVARGMEMQNLTVGVDCFEGEDDVIRMDHHYESRVTNHDYIILKSFQNTIVTPHVAFFTDQAVSDMVQCSLESLKLFAEGKPVPLEVRAKH